MTQSSLMANNSLSASDARYMLFLKPTTISSAMIFLLFSVVPNSIANLRHRFVTLLFDRSFSQATGRPTRKELKTLPESTHGVAVLFVNSRTSQEEAIFDHGFHSAFVSLCCSARFRLWKTYFFKSGQNSPNAFAAIRPAKPSDERRSASCALASLRTRQVFETKLLPKIPT